ATPQRGLRYETGAVHQVLLARPRSAFTSPHADAPDYAGISLESDSIIWLAETDANVLRGWIDLNGSHIRWLGSIRLDGYLHVYSDAGVRVATESAGTILESHNTSEGPNVWQFRLRHTGANVEIDNLRGT